nr:hypothetical protein [Tanacetum cinerariifolium]
MGNTKNNRISQSSSSNKTNKVEDQSRSVNSRKNKKNRVAKTKYNAYVIQSMINVNSKSVCAIYNEWLIDSNHDQCVIDYVHDVNVLSKSKPAKRKIKKQIWKPTSKIDDWDTLLQLLFDEYFYPPPCVDHPVPKVAAPVSAKEALPPHVIPLNAKEADQDIKVAHMDNNPRFGILIPKPTLFYYFDAFLSSVEPNNYKEALIESCWIKAMQEELNKFKRLEVWELVPLLDRVMIITLKWIYKVKLDELGGVLKNKSCTWMAFGGNTRDLGSFGEETNEITDLLQILEEVLLIERGDDITSIKQSHRELFSDGVWNLETASGYGNLKRI